MKFQLKALAAALALVAAMPAHAAIDNTLTGNSSLILTLLDAGTNISASFDLGKNYADFNINTIGAGNIDSNIDAPGSVLSWNLAGNGLNNGVQGDYATAWSTFFATANVANVKFGIFAGDNTGSGFGSRGLITSYVSNGTNLTGQGLINMLGTQNTYTAAVGAVNGNVFQNHTTTLNGSSVSTSGQGYAIPYYNGNKNANAGPVALGLLGGSVGVAQLVNTGGSVAVPQAVQTIFTDATFTLTSTGQLTYLVTAVPEADSWAMMLLGLGFMGFVARRKQA